MITIKRISKNDNGTYNLVFVCNRLDQINFLKAHLKDRCSDLNIQMVEE